MGRYCRKCHVEFSGFNIVTELGHEYHAQCFQCQTCGVVLNNHGFLIDGGNYYCESDYSKMLMKRLNLAGRGDEKEIELIFGTIKLVPNYSRGALAERLETYGRPSRDERAWYWKIMSCFIGCCI